MDWPLPAGLSPEVGQLLLERSRRRSFGRGEVVFHRGDPADVIHFIGKGCFAVRIATPLGDTAVLAILGPGEMFGEIALLQAGGLRSATVSALEPAVTRSIRKIDFEAIQDRHPEVTQLLVVTLAGQVRRLSDALVDALYVPADRRVIRRLADVCGRYATGDGDAVTVPLTQDELAELAGTSRATVNRVLREAERRGLLRLGRGRIDVLDAAALRRRAG